MNVYSNIIHNIQKVETTQMPISRWVEKENVLYTLDYYSTFKKIISFIYLFMAVVGLRCCAQPFS